ncbi:MULTISPECIES: type II secretion system secretin GspD [unclassified Lysobacter]|uniref:type II secretion system secretin GspD n=1 Tax=unclassified Lysobacter TaxID=2635362 RepID=UPI001F59419A|nr:MULTISPECIES: type II secretion system secretin GspD [unclassified Lysobacter]
MSLSQIRPMLVALLATLLAACASNPAPTMRRDAALGVAPPPGTSSADEDAVSRQPLESPDVDPRPVIRRGTGQTINREAASAPPPNLGGSTGQATFNFEGESLHAVVKAILGDMLGQNYLIAPGVQGTVTYGTPKPVSAAEAMSVLEMILGWNNARMVYSDGRYSIVPADAPLAGSVAPRIGPASNARGFESRVVPLRYISAAEMKKVLEPYARPNAIVNADPGRNVITLAGTRAELENYLRTIAIFDVDWMSSMSVGVFPLQSGKASKVVADLEKVFGEQGKSPVAGMFRFMPLEGANAVLVITPQPDYLDDIQQWLERIDGAGDAVRLYSYELKYITAKDLAERLAEVYGAARRGGDSGDGNVSLMPGLESTSIEDGGIDGKNGSSATIGDTGNDGYSGDTGSGPGGTGGQSMTLGRREGGDTAVSFEVDGSQVGVSAVDETNSILVRSSPQAWRSIKEVIEKLDVMPMQVHIEAQVAEVTLTGDLSYGVNWFFERAVTDAGLPSAVGRTTWSGLAGNVSGTPLGGTAAGMAWTFLGRNAAAIISALDEVSDVRMLQSPSLMVRNNEEATLNDGTRIPIASVTVNPIVGDNTYSQVQYLDTGTILKIRPRLTKDGTVFLDIVSEVSAPQGEPDQNGNVRISSRKVKTNAILQSGDTTLIAGLIQDGTVRGSTGFPGLSRIPVLGGLFGRQSSNKSRTEVIVLITPTIVRDPREARDLTDEYTRRFRAMEPLRSTPSGN